MNTAPIGECSQPLRAQLAVMGGARTTHGLHECSDGSFCRLLLLQHVETSTVGLDKVRHGYPPIFCSVRAQIPQCRSSELYEAIYLIYLFFYLGGNVVLVAFLFGRETDRGCNFQPK